MHLLHVYITMLRKCRSKPFHHLESSTKDLLYLSACYLQITFCAIPSHVLHVVLNREDSDWRNRHQQVASSYSSFPTLHYPPRSNTVQRFHPVGVSREGVKKSIAWRVCDGYCGQERMEMGMNIPSSLQCVHTVCPREINWDTLCQIVPLQKTWMNCNCSDKTPALFFFADLIWIQNASALMIDSGKLWRLLSWRTWSNHCQEALVCPSSQEYRPIKLFYVNEHALI